MPKPGVLLALCFSVLVSPIGTSPVQAAPSSATVRWGFESSYDFADVPGLAVTWGRVEGLSIWAGASYIHESPRWIYARTLGERPHPYVRYVPVSVGLRASKVDDQGRRGGPFIELGPSLAPAWYTGPDGRSGFAMLGGFQTGAGIRFGAIDGTRIEFGLSYYLAEAIGEERDAVGRIGKPGETDVSLGAAYIAVGFGD